MLSLYAPARMSRASRQRPRTGDAAAEQQVGMANLGFKGGGFIRKLTVDARPSGMHVRLLPAGALRRNSAVSG